MRQRPATGSALGVLMITSALEHMDASRVGAPICALVEVGHLHAEYAAPLSTGQLFVQTRQIPSVLPALCVLQMNIPGFLAIPLLTPSVLLVGLHACLQNTNQLHAVLLLTGFAVRVLPIVIAMES